MQQLNKDQMNVFARAIMPELYRLQKRHDSKSKMLGGVYHLSDPEDLRALTAQAIKVITGTDKQPRKAA